MYMDDLIKSSIDQSKAERLARESTEILSQAGMPLRRLITNNVELQATLSPGEISPQSGATEFSDVHSKVLGLVWHPTTDCFTFDPRSFLEYYENFLGRCTKCHILSTLARLTPSSWCRRFCRKKIGSLASWPEKLGRVCPSRLKSSGRIGLNR